MCGDCNLPPAPSLGDAIAVIHLEKPYLCEAETAAPGFSSSSSSPSTGCGRSWRLRFSNRPTTETQDDGGSSSGGGESNTKVIYDMKPHWWRGELTLRIHQYGFPTITSTGESLPDNPTCHLISLQRPGGCGPDDDYRHEGSNNSSTLDRRLGLHVDRGGVIGRAVSVEIQGRKVGEGIMGRL